MNKKTWELLPFWFPKSQNNRNWTFVFIILTLLSIDWWAWDAKTRFADWIPIWIIYLIFIQFALAYSVWKFSKVFTIVEGNEMFIPEEQELIKWRSNSLHYLDKLDEIRGTDWKKTCPELYESMKVWYDLPKGLY